MIRKVSFENLDGLRFLAFLSVFLYHSFYTSSKAVAADPVYKAVKGAVMWGGLGVNFFFVLSGFLITYLLLEERKVSGRINIGHFYLRRLLRIWPLYFLAVFTGFIVVPVLKDLLGYVTAETANPWFFVSFLSNFNNILYGPADSSILTVLWSVSIEEQFYLFWPLLLWYTPRQHYYSAFISLILISVLFVAWYSKDYDMKHFHTLSAVCELCTGGLIAWLITDNDRFRELIAGMKRSWIGLIYIAGGLVVVAYPRLDALAYINAVTKLVLSFFFAFVILEQNFARNSLFKIGKIKLFTFLGKYSYGLYCLHFIGILAAMHLSRGAGIADTLSATLLVEPLLSLMITIGLSWCSFHFYEERFLVYKKSFSVITR